MDIKLVSNWASLLCLHQAELDYVRGEMLSWWTLQIQPVALWLCLQAMCETQWEYVSTWSVHGASPPACDRAAQRWGLVVVNVELCEWMACFSFLLYVSVTCYQIYNIVCCFSPAYQSSKYLMSEFTCSALLHFMNSTCLWLWCDCLAVVQLVLKTMFMLVLRYTLLSSQWLLADG